jgi:hypothetical protein
MRKIGSPIENTIKEEIVHHEKIFCFRSVFAPAHVAAGGV